jgi:hypothetical protein
MFNDGLDAVSTENPALPNLSAPLSGELTEHFHELLGALRDAWETEEFWNGLASLDLIVEVIVNALRTAGPRSYAEPRAARLIRLGPV